MCTNGVNCIGGNHLAQERGMADMELPQMSSTAFPGAAPSYPAGLCRVDSAGAPPLVEPL